MGGCQKNGEEKEGQHDGLVTGDTVTMIVPPFYNNFNSELSISH